MKSLHEALKHLYQTYAEELARTGTDEYITHHDDGTRIETYMSPRSGMMMAIHLPDETEVVDLRYQDDFETVGFSTREDDSEQSFRHIGEINTEGEIVYQIRDETGRMGRRESIQPHPEILALLQTRIDKASSELIAHAVNVQTLQKQFQEMLDSLPGLEEDLGEIEAAKRNADLEAIPVREREAVLQERLESRLTLLEDVANLRKELANQDQAMIASLQGVKVEKEPLRLKDYDQMTAGSFREYMEDQVEGAHFEMLAAPYDTMETMTQRVIRTDSDLDHPVVVMKPGAEGQQPDAGSVSAFRQPNFMCVILPSVNWVDAELLTEISGVRATYYNVYNFQGGKKGNLITEVRPDGPRRESVDVVENRVQELAQKIAGKIPGMTTDEVLRRVDTVRRREMDELGNLGL
jgi:hypothetical protein